MIKTFDNKEWKREDMLKRMYDDEFYYGYLGSNALSSSSAKKLIQSPKAYLKSLKINSDAQPLRDGRLVHLSVLEPHKVKDLTIINGSKATKAFKFCSFRRYFRLFQLDCPKAQIRGFWCYSCCNNFCCNWCLQSALGVVYGR